MICLGMYVSMHVLSFINLCVSNDAYRLTVNRFIATYSILADAKTNTEYKAAVIAKTAYKQSLDPSYLSPFAQKEREYF